MNKSYRRILGAAAALGLAASPFLVFATDYTTPALLTAYIQAQLVIAFTAIIPFVVWALMLVLGYGVCLWAIGKVRSLFGNKRKK